MKRGRLFAAFFLVFFFIFFIHFDAKAASFTDGTSTYGLADGTLSHNSSTWVDVDNDGDLDLYLIDESAANKLLQNNGANQAFTDVTSTYNVASESTGADYMAAWIDVDNDGDFDLYVTYDSANNKLYQNNGPNRAFTDVTSTYGVADGTTFHQSASWIDFDNDGDLDLYIVNWNSNNKLYQNNGANQAFTDVTSTYGVADGTVSHQANSWIDIDNDGDLDLYAVNWNSNNKLYQNNGANQAFTDVTSTYGISDGITGHISSSWVDIDNDRDLDLYAINYGANNKVYQNNGSGQAFTDVTSTYGIANGTTSHYINSWIDIDNDGDLDLYSLSANANNKVYQNNGSGQAFTDVTSSYGISDGTTFHLSTSWADIENDGDLDLYVTNWGANNKFYLNPGQGNKYLKVIVKNSSGRYQYHARVEVDIDGNNDFSSSGSLAVQYQSNSNNNSSTGYVLSQDPAYLLFGLGSASTCNYDVRVYLPGVSPSSSPSYAEQNVCPNQTLSFPIASSSTNSSSSSSDTPQINQLSGGSGSFTAKDSSPDQKVNVIIEQGTFKFDAYVQTNQKTSGENFVNSVKPTNAALSSLPNNIIVTGGGIIGIRVNIPIIYTAPVLGASSDKKNNSKAQTTSTVYWQIGQIQDIWYRDFYNGAKILPSIQNKPSIIALSYSNHNLIIPSEPTKSFKESSLKLAYSENGLKWSILPSSVVDAINNTVAAIHKVGGYYMIVGRL